MKRNTQLNIPFRILVSALLINLSIHQNIGAVGLMPVPEFNSFNVSATVTFDTTTNWYSYNYAFGNPVTNTGRVWHIKLDITQPYESLWNYSGLTIPFGTQNFDFIDMYNKRKPLALAPGASIVPIGQIVPDGWVGGFGRDGMASFAARTGTPMIEPGDTKSGFTLTSPGLPTIRTIEIKPIWVILVDDHSDLSPEDRAAGDNISRNLSVVTNTIGPARNISEGSYEHWNMLRENISKAIELEWITDKEFADSLLTMLFQARTAANNQDGKIAKNILLDAQILLNSTDISQRKQGIHDLILHHLRSLIAYTADIPPRFEPQLTVTPITKKLSIGNLHIIKAKVVNLADENAPVSGFPLTFFIKNGPHQGLSESGSTDSAGEIEFKYIGKNIGKDKVVVKPLPPS